MRSNRAALRGVNAEMRLSKFHSGPFGGLNNGILRRCGAFREIKTPHIVTRLKSHQTQTQREATGERKRVLSASNVTNAARNSTPAFQGRRLHELKGAR